MSHLLRLMAIGLLALPAARAAVAGEAAPCWDAKDLAAARLYEFREMTLNTQLRCRLIGVDLMPNYEAMKLRYHASFEAADKVIQAHYRADQDKPHWLQYQQYQTHVTNIYGGGTTTVPHCRAFMIVMGQLADPATPADALDTVVGAMIRDPHLDAVACAATAAP